MKNFSDNQDKKGFGIIEAIIGVALSATILTVFVSLLLQSVKVSHANTSELKATMYLQELVEVTKDLEQSATSTIFISGSPCPISCHPEISGENWILAPGQETLESGTFNRSVVIEEVPAIPPDDYVKRVTAIVSWNNGYQNRDLTFETYLYYYGI